MSKYLSRLFLAGCLGSSCAANATQTGLDPGFGERGLKQLAALGDPIRGLGGCPHANGSASAVGLAPVANEIRIARLGTDGQLDSTFSGDGIASVALGGNCVFDAAPTTACVGVGNAEPGDDRMLIAGSIAVAGAPDRVCIVSLDLHQGRLDPVFNAGSPSVVDPIASANPDAQRLDISGIHPGANGEWLLTGATVQGSDQRAMVARIGAGGALLAARVPVAWQPNNFVLRSANVARIDSDGALRVLGNATQYNVDAQPVFTGWALSRLDPQTLEFITIDAIAAQSNTLVRHGRYVGGGLSVAAASRGTQTPYLLLVRSSQVTELPLPAIAPINGVPTFLYDDARAGSATSASGGRAVVVMRLASNAQLAAGYYAALVKLATPNTPDQVDVSYGNAGAVQFAWRPRGSTCSPELNPWQLLGNIASWGPATIMVGHANSDCGENPPIHLLAARIDSAAEFLFRDGFD